VVLKFSGRKSHRRRKLNPPGTLKMVREFSLEKSRVESLVGERVSEFSVSAGCSEGDGMAGSLKSINVTTLSGNTLHLILKEIDVSSPWGATQATETGPFKIENMVYSTLIPKLTEFAQSRGVDAQIPVPHVYDSYKGQQPLDDYICMIDVRFDGYKMADKYVGLTLEETLLVMKEIGRFHALTYSFIKWEGEKIFSTPPFSTLVEFYNLYLPDGETINPKMREFAFVFQGAINNGLDLMEKRNPTLHQRMKVHFEKTVGAEKYPQLSMGTSFGTDLKYFPVIIHGDLWSNNIMFKYDNDGVPVSMKFLDFQLSRRGNIYEDLAYFVYTSTTPELRRKHPFSPLQTYFDSFTKSLKELKVAQPIGFSLGTFLDAFKENLPNVFRHMHFAIPLQLGTPIPRVMEMMQGGQNGGTKEEPGAPTSPPQVPHTREQEVQMFFMMMKIQMETSERALERLEAIAQEMAYLNVI